LNQKYAPYSFNPDKYYIKNTTMTQTKDVSWNDGTGRYLMIYDEDTKLELMSSVFLRPPTFLNSFNPLVIVQNIGDKQDAYRFMAPFKQFDVDEGKLKSKETDISIYSKVVTEIVVGGTALVWYNDGGLYYLNVSGSQGDWDNFLEVTYKADQYLLYDSKFFSSGQLFSQFGGFLSLVTTILTFFSSSIMREDVQEFLVTKFLIEKRKPHETAGEFKDRVKEGKRKLRESRDITNQVNMFFEFQETKATVKDLAEEAARKQIIFELVTRELEDSIKASEKDRGGQVAQQSTINDRVKDRASSQEQEINFLKKENDIMKKEKDIMKKENGIII